VEALPTAGSDADARLQAIEEAVSGGNTDLTALGFWRLVAEVKADPTLVRTLADRVGTADTTAFRSAVRLRAPVWFGNLVLLACAAAGAVAVAIAMHDTTSPAVAGLALVIAGGSWSVSFHCPAHWLAGRLAGIRFTDYFIGGPPPPRPGLKIDYASYLRARPEVRARMHAAGALATKVAPFLALAFWPASDAPAWAALVLVALGLGQIATDVVFSVRSSDWKRFRREMALARSGRDPR
jgi:hypothetical protein